MFKVGIKLVSICLVSLESLRGYLTDKIRNQATNNSNTWLDYSKNETMLFLTSTNNIFPSSSRSPAARPTINRPSNPAGRGDWKRAFRWSMAWPLARRICRSKDILQSRGMLLVPRGRNLPNSYVTTREYPWIHCCWQQRYVISHCVITIIQPHRRFNFGSKIIKYSPHFTSWLLFPF